VAASTPPLSAGFLLPAGAPESLRRNLRNRAVGFLILFLSASIGGLFIQGAKLQRGEFPSLEILSRYVTATQSGNVWFLRECYGLALLALLLRRGKGNLSGIRMIALSALPLIASRSLTSHAIAVKTQTFWVVTADAVHLMATAIWAGGLIAVLTAFRESRKQHKLNAIWAVQFINRFSRLAMVCVALLVCAGGYLSWVHIGSFTTLVNTESGKVLMIKLGIFAAMLSLGAINFLSTRPALLRAVQSNEQDYAAIDTAAKRIAAESLLGLAIFATTGVLTVLPPGIHALHAAAQEHPTPIQMRTLQTAEGASVKILAPKNDQTFSGDQVALRFKLTKGKQGHHAHAYVDGELMGMFEGSSGTLNGIKPGKHVLELRVVADDHQTELDASDKVNFTVR
jgi:putative copper export protein